MESEIEDVLDNLSRVNLSDIIEDTQGFGGVIKELVSLYVEYFSTKPDRLRDIGVREKVENILYRIYTQRNSDNAGCMESNPYKFPFFRTIIHDGIKNGLPDIPVDRQIVQLFRAKLDGRWFFDKVLCVSPYTKNVGQAILLLTLTANLVIWILIYLKTSNSGSEGNKSSP